MESVRKEPMDSRWALANWVPRFRMRCDCFSKSANSTSGVEDARVGAHAGRKLTRRGQVIVVTRVDQIEDVPFLVGEEDGALVVNPFIQTPAHALEARPILGIMIDAVAQNQVVELPDGLLEMIGDLEALQLHRRQPLPQFARALPGRVSRPADQNEHPDHSQHECHQPVFYGPAHCMISLAKRISVRFPQAKPRFAPPLINRLSGLVTQLSAGRAPPAG